MKVQEGGATTTMAAAEAVQLPHVLLVSFPLQGHVNPLLRLGRRLAARGGLLVTFATFRHAGLIRADVLRREDGAACAAVGLGGRLRFEHLDGLDGGGSLLAPDDLLRRVVDVGPAALAELLRRQAAAGRPVSCVVNNPFVPWAHDVAREMAVPCCAMLWIQSCAVLSLYYHFYNFSPGVFFPGDGEATPEATVSLPGLPTIAMDDMPLMVHPEFEHTLWSQMLRAQLVGMKKKTVSWVLVNSFYELEPAVFESLRAHAPVVPVGPLLEEEHDAGDGDDDEPAAAAADEDNGCMAWLDARPPRSVVYVAFGSLVNIGRDEMAAVAEALVAAGRPFLWVVRDDSRELLPPGALTALAIAAGKVVAWCPQGRVLAHAAVGCFVTHCGWNSAAEALAAGLPVVGYPWWSDQFTNAKFLADEYKVGVRLPAPVTKDALRACVDEVMSGPEAEAIRARAAAWKERAAAAVAGGGSSDGSLEVFVDYVRRSVEHGVGKICSAVEPNKAAITVSPYTSYPNKPSLL